MKSIIYQIALAMAMATSLFAWKGDGRIPKTQDPIEFPKELEAMIVETIAEGGSIRESQNTGRDNFIKNDPRDWETTLAKIANDPGKYGTMTSWGALDVAHFRKNISRNPVFVEAAIKILRAETDKALEKIDELKPGEEAKKFGAIGGIGGYVPYALEIGSPEILQNILIYFNSPEELRIGLINEFTPKNVSQALLNYGDERNLSEAKIFSKHLREIGRADVADDIDRSISRIEKEAGRKNDRSPSNTIPNPKDSQAHDHPDKAGGAISVLPLSIAIAITGLLVFIIRKRKTSS